MAALLTWLPVLLRRRKRERLLAEAAHWPTTTAHLLRSVVIERDALAEEGTAFQDRQIESAFYFIVRDKVDGSYFGGHLCSVPLSDSEAHRALRTLPEDTPVIIRYNPAKPDQTVALPEDNPGFPVPLWPR
jgi:hypothetical protein